MKALRYLVCLLSTVEQQAGVTNLLQRSFTLLSNDWQTLGIFNGEAQTVRLTDPGAQGQPRAFYRVLGATP